jgi:aminoglycoside phosphotransferase (APT) family kinase protein
MDPEVATAVLGALQTALGARGLAYRTGPDLFQDGGENTIATLSLTGGTGALEGPLILRCYPAERDPAGVRFEATLHEGLLAQGYPVPRVHAAIDRAGSWGGAFMLMERLPGRSPLHEVGELDRVFASPWTALRTLPRLAWEGAQRVPTLLGEWMARLHALDPGPIVRALETRGIGLHAFTTRGRLEELERRAGAARLDGLASALDWLRKRHREPTEPTLCHSDFQFLNMLIDAGRPTGVIDWSTQHCTFDDPVFDAGNTTALLALRLPGIPAPVRRVLELAQRRMRRRFLASYQASSGRTLDAERLRWAEVFRYVREMVVAGELLRGSEHTGSPTLRHDEPPWSIPELREWVLEAIAARTGLAATLPPPPALAS